MRRRWLGASLAVGTCFAFAACGDQFSAGEDQDALPPIMVPDATSADDTRADATFGQDTSMGPDVAPPPEDAAHDAPHDGFVPPPNEAGVDVVTMPDVVTLPDVVTMPDVISPPDAYVAPDACSGEVASEADAVFVKQGGSGTTCSMGAPCGTFAAAFAALGGKTKVYVAEGTYTESFNVPGGITVQGGWLDNGGSWQRDCVPTAAASTTIKGDGSLAYAVGYAASGTSTLDTLTIQSSGGGGSVSVYGVFVNGTGQTSPVLDLNNVFVTAADAVGGAPGQKGNTGGGGTGTCGSTNSTCSTGANGGTGTQGSVAAPSTYTANGYVPTTAGTGGTGGTGAAGTTPTTGPTCTTNGVHCAWSASDGACVPTPVDSCGTWGTCGCPGAGGTGGTGGSGGGSSIALYVWSATVNVNGGSLSAGKGGDGGAGGTGGDPGVGDPGQQGNDGSTCTYASCTGNTSLTCKGSGLCAFGMGGTAGGTGGSGGTGGQGGGGNGGDSYAYFVGGGGSVPPNNAATSFKSGGAAGSPNGAAGHGATHN